MSAEDINDRDMNFSENFVIISSRKTDFLTIFIEKLRAENEEIITPNVISAIVHIVAKLDLLLFLSRTELKEGYLHIDTSLEELDREKIGEEIAKKLNAKEDI
ncbi:MAG: hypothetical protein ACYDCP_00495 [Thermoplasmataceae archaeon]